MKKVTVSSEVLGGLAVYHRGTIEEDEWKRARWALGLSVGDKYLVTTKTREEAIRIGEKLMELCPAMATIRSQDDFFDVISESVLTWIILCQESKGWVDYNG